MDGDLELFILVAGQLSQQDVSGKLLSCGELRLAMIAVEVRCISTSTILEPIVAHGSTSFTVMMAASLESLTVILTSVTAAPAALELMVAS